MALAWVYTVRMDSRRVVWDKDNRRHIEKEHAERAIMAREVSEVLNDPDRIEGGEDLRVGQGYRPVLGQTQAGRWLYVVYVSDSEGRYPVHARQAGQRTRRRFEKK